MTLCGLSACLPQGDSRQCPKLMVACKGASHTNLGPANPSHRKQAHGHPTQVRPILKPPWPGVWICLADRQDHQLHNAAVDFNTRHSRPTILKCHQLSQIIPDTVEPSCQSEKLISKSICH